MSEAFDGATLRQIVDATTELLVIFEDDGRITFVNNAAHDLLGGAPAGYVGTNLLEHVHPDEVEEGLMLLALTVGHGGVRGSMNFRVRRYDGTYVDMEFTAGSLAEATPPLRWLLGRRSSTRLTLEGILNGLVTNSDTAAMMRSLFDLLDWQLHGSMLAITWWTGAGEPRTVSTGLPDSFAEPDLSPDSPWSEASQRGGYVEELALDRLTEDRQATARLLRLGAYRIEAVDAPVHPALVTVWTQEGGLPPRLHVRALSMIRKTLAVMLRWIEQARQLDFAATHDSLTQIANRKAFFDALSRTRSGAVLYCDLDGFKAVNDEYGHAVGDELLQLVAKRILRCVRDNDLVARLGGDEFGVICPAADLEAAEHITGRIRAAFEDWFHVGHHALHVGITVGIGHSAKRLDESVVEAADAYLYAQKRGRVSR